MTSSDTLAGWPGRAGLLVLVLALTHWLVRRKGGWKALWRRIRREVVLTARAFSTPVRTELRYRRGLRLLVRLLRDPSVWADAERATALAAAVHPAARPYGVLAGPELIGVLVAAKGTSLPVPPEPWAADDSDPRLWWIARTDLTGELPDGTPPLLVCAGLDAGYAVLLDLRGGPTATSVYGAPRAARTARAVLQALAAQLDARLPEGRVAVADGVHPRFPGPTAAETVALPGIDVAVCAEPLDRPLPAGVRLLSLGVARGRTRLLEVGHDAVLTVHGAPATGQVDVLPLSRAVARTLSGLPPYSGDADDDVRPEAVPAPRRPVEVRPMIGDLTEPDLAPEPDLDADGPSAAEPTGVSATRPSPPAPVPPARAVTAASVPDADDDLAEPATSGTAGVSVAAPKAP
ncbi:hypothetical protein ACFV0T_22015 [Streptomyces sp. NPDC059582]|uniref:hypothetical protein n=1 Tax=Streptomyces sp. NPDC059582 TaxID=3346875 RepID=UPI0036D11461